MSRKKLNELIDELNGKIIIKDNTVEDINNATVRVVKPEKTADEGEFIYTDGNPVKKDTSYHIHYTDNFKEYYMTGQSHEKEVSRIIYRIKNQTDFSTYSGLKTPKKLYLEPQLKIPSDKDYEKGFMERCFAKKANETMSPIFEIDKEKLNSSPLYKYLKIRWYITGKKEIVGNRNTKIISQASEIFPSITKYLSPFQYYRQEEGDETKEDILGKLGVQSVGPDTQQNNNQTTTTNTSTQTSTGGSSAGSSGGSSGGSGGSGGGSGGGGGY